MDLNGASVLLTGARRVGAALALDLADRGSNIALTYRRDEASARTLAERIASTGGRAMVVQADLAAPGAADRAVSAVVDRFGRIDVLVSMASDFKKVAFDQLTDDHYHQMIAANLTAPYLSAVAAGRAMLAAPARAGIKGKIVFTGDWATERPYRDHLPYLVAKGGLKTLTLALARELAPWVHVNLAQPAMIAAPEDYTEEQRDAVIAHTPLARTGRPQDLNNLILYLLEGTDFATGGCYRVDGGRFLGQDDDGA